jgi:aminoglycoside phosphotransferase (APT) family kinase protein
VFTHGELPVRHVFVDGDRMTGVIDWSEAGHGDAMYDLASSTLGHEEHPGDVIRAWWTLRSLRAARWLIEHGFDPASPGCELAVLRSQR